MNITITLENVYKKYNKSSVDNVLRYGNRGKDNIGVVLQQTSVDQELSVRGNFRVS